jgi:hypothetical protein
MHLGKLNLVSLLAALGLFFLPWIEVQCQGTALVQQTGLQAATKKVAVAETFEKMASQMSGPGVKTSNTEAKETKEWPIFLLASAGAAVLAFLLALGGIGSSGGSKASSFLAIIALALAITQMVVKFPMEKEMMAEMKNKNAPPSSAAEDPVSAQMGAQMSAQLEGMIKVKYLPAFWGYLAALAIPGLLGIIASPGRRETYPPPPQ